MKKNTLLIIFIGLISHLFSQKIVSVELQETLSKQTLSIFLLGNPVEYGVETYKVLYETMDTDGTIDTASGLMVLPILEEDESLPFLAYQHGTASTRNAIPSNTTTQERFLTYSMASQGYYVTAADYLGLGDSKRAIHPYLHADSEASAAIDLVKAAKSYIDSKGLLTNGQLFITGYSQGGHAAMAMHKALNNTSVAGLRVAASSPMSGIYNVSGELSQVSNLEIPYDRPSYIVWIIVGHQSVYGDLYNDLSEVFLPEYIPTIQQFADGNLSQRSLNQELVTKLTENHGASIPKFLFTNSFLSSFENDPDNKFLAALKDDDVYDWIPNTPMRMMYCTADEQVPFTNATFTDSIMNANDAINVQAIDVKSDADHGDCVIPAVLGTLTFFASIPKPTNTGITTKVLLEGFYDEQMALMHTQLNEKNLLPLQQPFNRAPWNYTGAEAVASIPNGVVDWVLLMTRDAAGTILDQAAGFLTRTGAVVGIEGQDAVPIDAATSNYFSIHHQSHLSVISSQPYDGQLYDFTLSASTAQGADQLKPIDGKYVLFAGDYDGTGLINSLDFNDWKKQGAALNDYLPIDGDGNGIVNSLDYNLWVKNRSKVGAPTIR